MGGDNGSDDEPQSGLSRGQSGCCRGAPPDYLDPKPFTPDGR
jgi:hypothetical protein